MPETTEVPIAQAPTMKEYNSARAKGLTAIPAEAQAEPEEKKPSVKAEEAEEIESDSETDKEDEPKKSKGGGFQRRIDKLTRHARELETELARVRGERQQPVTVSADKPKVEDVGTKYKTYEDYIEALADWKAESKRAEWEQKEAERVETEDRNATFAAYQKRVAEAAEKYDDFEEVVTNSDLQIPQGVELAVVELKNGPDVAYYLGKHPELCEQLCEMRPLEAIAEVGAIARELAGARPTEKPKSTAAKPITPVGKGSTKSTVPLGEMSMSDYKKARAAGRTA